MTAPRRCLYRMTTGRTAWSVALRRGMLANDWEVAGAMPPGAAPDLVMLEREGGSALVFLGAKAPVDDVAHADLVLCASARALPGLRAAGARRVLHLPLCSDLTETTPPLPAASTQPYCALNSDDRSERLEGFFAIFSEGLGFLTRRQQLRVAGSLGVALPGDPRWRPFAATNAARFLAVGPLSRDALAPFYQGARAVLMPVTHDAEAEIADALACGRPVIAASQMLEVAGPLPEGVLGAGVWVADTPPAWRALIRAAMAGELPAPPLSLRAAVSPGRFAQALGEAIGALPPG